MANETNAYKVWTIWQVLYEKKNAQNKTFLSRMLMYLRYQDRTFISEHLNVFHRILNQLSTMEMKLDDEIHTFCLIGSLPDSWETLVMSLINFIPNGILTLKMVKVSMLNEENKRKD